MPVWCRRGPLPCLAGGDRACSLCSQFGCDSCQFCADTQVDNLVFYPVGELAYCWNEAARTRRTTFSLMAYRSGITWPSTSTASSTASCASPSQQMLRVLYLSASLDLPLEGVVVRLETPLGSGNGLADKRHTDAAIDFALNDPRAAMGRLKREDVLTAEDARDLAAQAQLHPRLGDDDRGADGDRAALGRIYPQREPVPDGDGPRPFTDVRGPLRIVAQVSEDGPYVHRRSVNLDRGRHRSLKDRPAPPLRLIRGRAGGRYRGSG